MGKVGRLHDRRFAFEDRNDLAPSVDMISHRDAVDSCVPEFFIDIGRESRTSCGILCVCDDQVQLILPPQCGQRLQENLTSRFADDVADMEDTHEE